MVSADVTSSCVQTVMSSAKNCVMMTVQSTDAGNPSGLVGSFVCSLMTMSRKRVVSSEKTKSAVMKGAEQMGEQMRYEKELSDNDDKCSSSISSSSYES